MPKILVADDDARMVRLLTMTLPPEYEVSTASDGEAAVAVANSVRPDLILLDVNMPGLNGFEVLRAIRQSDVLKDTRVIMVTARSDPSDRAMGLQLGADAYLNKPFSPLTLLAEITQILGEDEAEGR